MADISQEEIVHIAKLAMLNLTRERNRRLYKRYERYFGVCRND